MTQKCDQCEKDAIGTDSMGLPACFAHTGGLRSAAASKRQADANDHARWTWHGRMLVTCRLDGTIPLNSKVVLEVTNETAAFSDAFMQHGDSFPRDLIAAAPDLFDAATQAYSTLARARLELKPLLPNFDAMLEALRSAVRKARL